MFIYLLGQTWFYAWIAATLILTTTVLDRYKERVSAISASFIDRKLHAGTEEKSSESSASTRRKKITFRAGDFLFHTLPRAYSLRRPGNSRQ